MRHTIKSIVRSALFLACLPVSSQESTVCRTTTPSAMVKIFDKSMVLNEKFKRSVGGADTNEYRRLRTEIENYDEETVMPCVRRASQLMREKSNAILLHKLMELTVSHENSADETMSYALGKLFAAHPAAVDRELHKFPSREKKIIFNSVKTGWQNVQTELPSALREDREARLAKLLRPLRTQ